MGGSLGAQKWGTGSITPTGVHTLSAPCALLGAWPPKRSKPSSARAHTHTPTHMQARPTETNPSSCPRPGASRAPCRPPPRTFQESQGPLSCCVCQGSSRKSPPPPNSRQRQTRCTAEGPANQPEICTPGSLPLGGRETAPGHQANHIPEKETLPRCSVPGPRVLLPWPIHPPPRWAQHPLILQLLARGWQAHSSEGHTHCGNLNSAQHVDLGADSSQPPWAGRGQAPHLPVSLPHVALQARSVWRDVEPGRSREEQDTAGCPPSPQARAHTWPGPPTHLHDSESWKSRCSRQMLGDGREKTGEPGCGGSWSP